ncbi:hypothetical protein ACLOJK_017485 [Asimina triloba]
MVCRRCSPAFPGPKQTGQWMSMLSLLSAFATVYCGEHNCINIGPAADRSGRVPWSRSLTDEEAKPFIGRDFIEAKKWLLDGH